MKTKAHGLEVVTRDRATQKKSPDGANPTAQPIVAPPSLQSRGQLRRAVALDEQADRLAASGDWPAARRLRHEARRLRQLAAGPRPEPPVVDLERELAAARLARWGDRSAA